jgi:hypothetical protein
MIIKKLIYFVVKYYLKFTFHVDKVAKSWYSMINIHIALSSLSINKANFHSAEQ